MDNAGYVGGAASALTGIPGGAVLGKMLRNNYWQDNAWQSSAMGGENLIGEEIPPRQTINDIIDEWAEPEQSPYEPDQQSQQPPSVFGNPFFDPWAFTTQRGFRGIK